MNVSQFFAVKTEPIRRQTEPKPLGLALSPDELNETSVFAAEVKRISPDKLSSRRMSSFAGWAPSSSSEAFRLNFVSV